jgi:proteic killer suppression protein
VIRSFSDQGTEDVFDGLDTKAARHTCPQELWDRAQRRLSQVEYASALEDLQLPRSNRLHALTGDRLGQHSISINMKYRVCFAWTEEGTKRVQITTSH